MDPVSTDGSLAFSDGTSWDPDSVGGPALNIRLNGEWKQVNLGAGVTGPQGLDGPQGVTGPSYLVNNSGQYKITTSDGTIGGLQAEDNVTFDGLTFSITGDLSVSGTIEQPTIVSPTINTPSISYANLQGDTTLQNITTVLIDTVVVDVPTVDFDFSLGSVFYITSPSNDFTLNVTNLPTTDSRAVNITVFVSQGISSFGLTGFEIGGVSQTIKWIGGTQSTPLPTTVTAYTFNILRSGDNWVEVLGAAGIYA